MKRIILLFAAFCLIGFANAETVTRTFYFDFGMNGNSSGEITTSPDANGHYWNNIGDQGIASNKPSQDYVYDLVDAANTATNVKVQLADTKFTANGMSGGGGLLSPNAELLGDLAVATATEDYLFASNSEHCTVGISGLDPAKGYQFKIFASRLATDDRVSDYTFRGAMAIQGSLQAAGTGIGANGENQNTSNVYLSPVMRPDAEGKISITVHRQFAGSGNYFPINCMRMQEMTDLHVADREIFIDCGHSDGTNGETTAAPDGNGIYWVNLFDNTVSATPVALTYRDGSAVNNGANVTIVTAFSRNGYNNGGNTAATYSSLLGAFGQKSVAGDYFFINKGTAKMRFNGLNPDKAYVFYIYGSRAYNSGFGQTVDKLKLDGLTTVNGTHHTGGNGMCYSGATNGWNEDAFTVMEPVFPDEDGNILLTLSDERGNYQHISGIRIEEYSDYQKPEITKYAALYMRGTAVEGGEVPMYLRAADGVTEGTSFEAFCQMTNGGILSFETADEVLSSGTCELTDGIYRIVYNTTSKTFTSLAINRVGLVGNVTSVGWDAAGLEMTYQGNGVWQGTFDLIVHTGDAERGQFCFNSSWDYTVKARNGVEGVVGFKPDQDYCGFDLADIYMRHGSKVVTLNMRNFTYSIECVDVTDNKITFFGSSVCNGQGASEEENVKHGYAWQYGQQLAARHTADNTLPEYEYSNASINGNNTLNLLKRYKGHMLGDCGEYVVIGLGLGNEGIHGATDQQAIYNQWKTNMQTLIGYGEAAGRVMIATNNYPRGDYNASDYGYVKAMNLEMHEWNIPTVNFLGALDNCEGNGQWASGYQDGDDVYHPSEAGHTEFMHAIVPSLFDALEAGKAKPTRQTGEGMALSADKKLILTPEEEVHAFSLAFRVKNISALIINWALTSGSAPIVESSLTDENWHTVFVSHYYAAGKTYVYIDGVLQGSAVDGKILLNQVTLSGACSISDLHFWRSGMNADEVAAFEAGKMLCSSLEIYCPLNDDNIANLAQSTNAIQITTYYIAGNGTDDTNGKWCNGSNWGFQALGTNGSITFYGVAGGKNYGFKIKDTNSWESGTEYTTFDYENSDAPLYGGNGTDMGFRLSEDADVTISVVDGKVRVNASKPLAYRSDYYYITGNCAAMGSWDPGAVALENDQITFSNLEAGWYEFKITNGSWDKQWKYSDLDVAKSSPMHKTYGDGGNICFRLQAAADVTVKMENGKVVLLINREYNITGNGDEAGGGAWLAGHPWWSYDADSKLDANYSRTYYNLPVGYYKFKVKENVDAAWDDDCTWGYSHLDTENSNAGEDGGGDGDDHNIGFQLSLPADVTIALVNNKIRLNTSPVYYLVGNGDASRGDWCGQKDWWTDDASSRLDATTLSKTYASLPAGEYKFRITNGKWTSDGGTVWDHTNVVFDESSFGYYTDNDKNICFSLSAETGVTIHFDPATEEILVTSSKGYFEATYHLVGANELISTGWDAGESTAELTASGAGIFQYVQENKYLAAGTYHYKLVANRSWDSGSAFPNGDGNNAEVSIAEDGIYTLTYTFAPATKTLNCVAERQTQDVTISAYQFSSFYSNKAFDVPEGLTAYIFTDVENDMLVMESINPIPANTGVVFYGAANQVYTLLETATETTYPANMLKGTIENTVINNSEVHYILSLSDQDEFGFFWPYNTDHGVGEFTNQAGKAYLELPGGSSAPARIRGFILAGPNMATGVEQTIVNDPMVKGKCYDILGREVANPQQRGLYIIDGKKVIIF